MLYKHWKKILLSLTAFFWASCDSDATSSQNSGSEDPNIVGSSSSEKNSNISSSSSTKESSSSVEEFAAEYGVPMSNISEPIVAPKYGVQIRDSIATDSLEKPLIAAKYGVIIARSTCEKIDSKLACDDGITCEENTTETMQSPECNGDVCAKYGVVIVKETTYKCDNGKVYNEAEFRSKYDILDGAVDLYGCPSDVCGSDTLIEESQPLYGVSNTITRPNN